MPIRSCLQTVLAQKDQLLEICPGARLGKPISCGRLSVSPRQTTTVNASTSKRQSLLGRRSGHGVRTNLLFTMSYRTGSKLDACRKPCVRMTFSSSQHPRLQKETWWSRTGSNRRHPACKAGALPAELRPLIVFILQHDLIQKVCNFLGPCPLERKWWAWEDLNLRPHAYQARALTN